MINVNSRRRANIKNKNTVWAEPNKKGGFIIYFGQKGTDIKTIAGAAQSRSTLEYNIRKAKVKNNIKVN
tara:strand:+ start:2449 stop:2655 length:207 start_codon:yes stop_codon:yes gene_type:complete